MQEALGPPITKPISLEEVAKTVAHVAGLDFAAKVKQQPTALA